MNRYLKILLVLTSVAVIIFLSIIEYRKYGFRQQQTSTFLYNIKHNIKNQFSDHQFNKGFEGYDYAILKNKKVINVKDNKEYILKDILNEKNQFINFWFKGCGGCEFEMPEIQTFYDNYGKNIRFAIISNDDAATVKKYIQDNEYTLPFFVFKDDNFPVGINTFPTSHLIVNNKTQFLYAGVGYFDNKGFYSYIDSVLTIK